MYLIHTITRKLNKNYCTLLGDSSCVLRCTCSDSFDCRQSRRVVKFKVLTSYNDNENQGTGQQPENVIKHQFLKSIHMITYEPYETHENVWGHGDIASGIFYVDTRWK
jgi:hypothetical protein